jgi:hypothetical protein
MYHLREMVDVMRRQRERDRWGGGHRVFVNHALSLCVPKARKVRPGTMLQETLFRGGLGREHAMDVVR